MNPDKFEAGMIRIENLVEINTIIDSFRLIKIASD